MGKSSILIRFAVRMRVSVRSHAVHNLTTRSLSQDDDFSESHITTIGVDFVRLVVFFVIIIVIALFAVRSLHFICQFSLVCLL